MSNIGAWGPCGTTGEICKQKYIFAAVTPYGYTGSGCSSNANTEPVVDHDCDNYCPNTYTYVSGSGDEGDCLFTTSCGAMNGVYDWVQNAVSEYNFLDDSAFPWGWSVAAFFVDGNASSPYCVIGPGLGSAPAGAAVDGAYYRGGGLFAWEDGDDFCASAQISAIQMVPGMVLEYVEASTACYSASGYLCNSCGGSSPSASTYRIPMPPMSLCSVVDDNVSVTYFPYQIGETYPCITVWNNSIPDLMVCEGSDPP
jgi:hypothetical protein